MLRHDVRTRSSPFTAFSDFVRLGRYDNLTGFFSPKNRLIMLFINNMLEESA